MLFSKKYLTAIKVEGMTCRHCKAKVKEALLAIDGVKKVNVELETGEVTIISKEEIDLGVIITMVAEAGFNVV